MDLMTKEFALALAKTKFTEGIASGEWTSVVINEYSKKIQSDLPFVNGEVYIGYISAQCVIATQMDILFAGGYVYGFVSTTTNQIFGMFDQIDNTTNQTGYFIGWKVVFTLVP